MEAKNENKQKKLEEGTGIQRREENIIEKANTQSISLFIIFFIAVLSFLVADIFNITLIG